MKVILPSLSGEEALTEALRLAARLKKKYGITFDRDPDDVFQALVGVLAGLGELAEECDNTKKIAALVEVVAKEKGEKTEEGVYVWPRHLKETAEEMGISWEELKKMLKRLENIKYDRRKRKYLIK